MPLTPDFTKQVIKAFALQSIRLRALEEIIPAFLKEDSITHRQLLDAIADKYMTHDRQVMQDLFDGKWSLTPDEERELLEAMFSHDDEPPSEKPE